MSCFGKIECVLGVVGWVIGGCIECVEVVVFGFYFGVFDNVEVDFVENVVYFFVDECEWMVSFVVEIGGR